MNGEFGVNSSGYGLLKSAHPFWVAVAGNAEEISAPPAWSLHAPNGALVATYTLTPDELAALRSNL